MLCDPLHTVSLGDRAVILNVSHTQLVHCMYCSSPPVQSVCGCVTAAPFLPDALAMLESPLETLLVSPTTLSVCDRQHRVSLLRVATTASYQ